MENDKEFLFRKMYLHEKSKQPEKTNEEEIILNEIDKLQGNDKTKENVYYIILWALIAVTKEDSQYKDRIKLVELLKFLFSQEDTGITLKSKTNSIKNHDISKKQIIDFQKVIIKQLSETYNFTKLADWDFPKDSDQFWEEINIMNLDLNVNKIHVFDFSLLTAKYLNLTKDIYPSFTIDKQGINQIIEIEKTRIIDEEKTYIRRLLNCINTYAKHYNCFDNTKKTIKTEEACFLYDILSILNLIKKDEFLSNQEKYQWIKKELNKKIT